MKAIIIDDIEQARQTLRKDLEVYAPDIEIIGEADSVISGAKLLKSTTPDLVFLDIQMQDGSGFDLLDILPEIRFQIIFITASDAHAIKAFRYAAIDYLLKPVDPDELQQALKKIKEQTNESSTKYALLQDTLQTNQRERLALHGQDKIHVVPIAEIVRCESTVNYTEFFFKDRKRIVVSRTLKEFDDLLQAHGFFRVHQSHLINTAFISEFVKSEGGHLKMSDGSIIPVSVRKRPEVLKMLEKL